jgi:hypothetical protein
MISNIEQKIKMYSLLKTDNAYYLKGKAFIDLAQVTSQKSYLDKAIEAYSEAIKLKLAGVLMGKHRFF